MSQQGTSKKILKRHLTHATSSSVNINKSSQSSSAQSNKSSQSSSQSTEIELEKIESFREKYKNIQIPKSYSKRKETETEKIVEIVSDNNNNADLLLAGITSQNMLMY